MRVAINCRSFLLKQYTGIGRYAYNLVKHLGEIDRDNQYLLYVQKALFDFKRKAPRIAAKNFSVKTDYFNRGLNATLGPVDVYHAPSPDFLNVDGAKIVVTVHDLIYKAYPQAHTPATIDTTERQMEEIVQKASKIICTSRSTTEDLFKYFAINKAKVCTVYHGVDKDIFYLLNPAEYKQAREFLNKKGIDQPFILFVGTIEPRKNLENLIRAFALLKDQKKFDGKLVVAGMKGWLTDGLSELIGRLDLRNDIIISGYATNAEVRFLYNLAEVFVFPSLYEGFGFPILEAFSCGAAVVTSNISSCAEVAGDAALTVDPQSFEQIAGAIITILEDRRLKMVLREKALKRAQDFSFRKTAEETLKVYREVFKQ